MAKREQPGVAEQQFQYGQSSNVSREMIRAGTAGKSRIRAGLTAAWKAKTSSMYSDETTKLSIALRLIGKQDAAKWIDRFFAKAPTSKKGRRGSRGERGDFGGDVRTLKQVQLNTGLLRAQSLRLNAIHALVDVVASDVLDIKTLITPRKVMVGGRATISSPLNPSTGTASGTMSKEFKDKAQRVHVAETAELVLKIVKEEQDKSELRKKFAWKENDETYKPKDHPDKKTHAKIDHMQEALDEMKRRTGFFSVIKLILANALGMIKRFLGPAGLVAMAGAIGYAVGSYLQTKFKLSEKIGDAIDYVLNKFGIGNTEDKREREYQDMLNAKVADNNLKLLGTDWKQDDLGKFTRISDGQQFDGKDLPKDVQEQFRLRDVGSWANMEQPEWSKSEVTAPPFTTGEYHTPAGGPNKRGALSRKDKGDKYSDLADLIARGEGTSDEKAQKEGYASGYDTTVYYGKYGNTFNDKPVSELTLGEVRLFQRDMIEKQKKEGKGEGERSCSRSGRRGG